MKRIVLATQNLGKLHEMRYILRHWNVELVGLQDIGLDSLEIEETGKTYIENALIKAKAVRELVNDAVLSDDSGMEVNALHGVPGIYSARYGGNISFAEKRKKLLEEMEGVEDRSAMFFCSIAYLDTDIEIVTEAQVEGKITTSERGTEGFGYDAIFELQDGRTFAEIPFREKHSLSHRYYAIKRLEEELREENINFK